MTDEKREVPPEIAVVHKDAQTLHEDATRIKKHATKILLVLAGIVVLIIALVIWFIAAGGAGRLMEMRLHAARYDMLRPTADFIYMKKTTKLMNDGLYDRIKKSADKHHHEKKRLTEEEYEAYISLLYFYERFYNVDTLAFRANTSAESTWNKKAYSKAGAKGLNQVMPSTFNDANKRILYKYGSYDIMSVYHNTEAALATWVNMREWLRWKLKRAPKIQEITWAYNAGNNTAYKAIRSGNHDDVLSTETSRHGEKVLFYYRNYKAQKYDVYWEEDVFRKAKKK